MERVLIISYIISMILTAGFIYCIYREKYWVFEFVNRIKKPIQQLVYVFLMLLSSYGKKGKVELQSMKEEWEEKYKKTFRERKVKDILSALLFAMVYGVLLVGALSPAQNIINDIASGIGMGMATVVVAFVGLVEVKNRLTKRRNKREDADQEKSDTE